MKVYNSFSKSTFENMFLKRHSQMSFSRQPQDVRSRLRFLLTRHKNGKKNEQKTAEKMAENDVFCSCLNIPFRTIMINVFYFLEGDEVLRKRRHHADWF